MPARSAFVSSGFATLILALPLAAQWHQAEAGPGPASRTDGALAETQTGGLLLSGGLRASARLGDLWSWTGTEWLLLQPAATPGPRSGASMTLDRERGEVVLFGGVTGTPGAGTLMADTWVFDGATWTQRLPLTSPSAREGAAFAFDARRRVAVLFGGRDSAGDLADVFEWNGTDWVPRATPVTPPALTTPVMVGDEARQELALLGSNAGTGEFWVFDGATWRQPATVVPTVAGTLLAYDATRARVVAHVGTGPSLRQTWEWDGRTWFLRATPASIPAMSVHGGVLGFDRTRSEVVAVAESLGSVTWIWSPQPPPVATPFGSACVDPARALGAAPDSVPALGRRFRMLIPRSGSTDLLLGLMGTSRTATSTGPLPAVIPVFNPLGCLQRVDVAAALLLPASSPAVWELPVPNTPALAGALLQAQAVFLGPSSIGDTTNGLEIQVGSVQTLGATTETFANELQRDALASGDHWLAGFAQPIGLGGDGRHGAFDPTFGVQVAPGVYEWSTDVQVIPASATLDGVPVTVTDGRFFFTDFVLPPNVTVHFVGVNPAQIFVRGRVDLRGRLDADGAAMTTFASRAQSFVGLSVLGQPGGPAGAGGGRGGDGGDRCLGNGPRVIGGVILENGHPGADVGLPAGHAYLAQRVNTGGPGSPMFPAHGVTSQLTGLATISGIFFGATAAGGGGGGFNGPGSSGTVPTPAPPSTSPPGLQMSSNPTPPGIAFNVLPFPGAPPPGYSSLVHFLVGGSGGGGGGSHPLFGISAGLSFNPWQAGGGGSGGGGAVAIRSGGPLSVTGMLLARGGTGAQFNADNPNTAPPDLPSSTTNNWGPASPGGGGSGGSFLLQSGADLTIGGVLDTSGGQGGRTGGWTVGATSPLVVSAGGAGAPGFYRIESNGAVQVANNAHVPPFNAAQNLGPLTDRDARSGSRSLWYVPGTLELTTYLRYELVVDCNGQTLLFSDDPAVGVPADATSQLVRVRFQAAHLDAAGLVDPATAGPWRDYAGSQLEVGLNRDRGDAFRFDLVLDTSSGQNLSVRELRVIFR